MDNNHPLCFIDDAPDNVCTEFLNEPGMAFSAMLIADLTSHCNCHNPSVPHDSANALGHETVSGFISQKDLISF